MKRQITCTLDAGVDPHQIEAKITGLAQRLATALRAVLDQIPGNPHRPQELAKLLQVGKTLSSQLHGALRNRDPLASVYLMPGPEGLRMVLKGAARKGVTDEAITAAGEAVEAFDQFLKRDVEGRAGLDAILSDSLPDAREKFELSNKQAMFRSAANLKGVATEIHLCVHLLRPGEDPTRNDLLVLAGLLGLRRLRPTAVAQVPSYFGPDLSHPMSCTLEGEPVEGMPEVLLEEFCSSPLPRLKVHEARDGLRYVVEANGFGLASAVNLVFAFNVRNCVHRYRAATHPRSSGVGEVVAQPTKTLILDTLLHEDTWPGCEPRLLIYDTSAQGPGDPNDPSRELDRLDLAESIRFVGRGIRRLRIPEIPDYQEMLRHVCGKVGWDVAEFRAYRCRIQYPFYGSQILMDFMPPPAPA